MLKLIITATMLMTALLLQAQVSEVRNLEGFTRIEVASGIELLYKEAHEKTSIMVEANEAHLRDIITEVNGETLKIYGRKNAMDAKIFVSAKGIGTFKASSNSRIIFENKVNGENINITLETGAYFKGYAKSEQLMNIETGKDTEFNGRLETVAFVGNFKDRSRVNISGNAKSAYLTTSTKAYCNAKNFLTENTRVDSADSKVIITSKDKIDVNAGKNATVTYFGSPKKAVIEDQLTTTRKYIRPSLIAME